MKKVLLAAAFLAVLICFWGCKKKEGNAGNANYINQSRNRGQPKSPVSQPLDYLPIRPGTTLIYKIELGEVEPLRYQEVIWPQGESGIVMATRGRFWGAINEDNEPQKTFFLKLRVKGPAAKQGGLEYPIGVELTVERDDLGVYRDAEQVFWAATTHGRFMCHEVVTYPSDSLGAPQGGAWGNWGTENGYSMRILFFGEKPGIQIGMREEPKDKLLFEGIKPVPGLNVPGLHFVRTVEPSTRKEGEEIDADTLNRGFKEHLYFARGKGLVYLEQKIDGKTSMIWRMIDSLE